jgi:hypothetical protein
MLFPYIKIESHGREILIQKISSHKLWKLSTPIYQGRGEFPSEVHECLKLIQRLKWENSGVLEIDGVVGTIHWTAEIDPKHFEQLFPKFLKDADEWEEILFKELSLQLAR